MKKILYFDCFSGASGDMILGACIDAGVPLSYLKKELGRLKLHGFSLKAGKVKKGGISGTKLDVIVKEEHHHHRKYSDIVKILEKSTLKKEIKDSAKNIFLNIAKAESKVHGEKVEQIHFHELGGVDTIVDVTGALVCFDKMGIEEFYVSAINVGGSCEIRSAHGILPNPAPATVELLKGFSIYAGTIHKELVTPTGAGIISSLVSPGKSLTGKEFKTTGAGFGAGFLNFEERPNVLRIITGELNGESFENDVTMVIETNIDDLVPLAYEPLMECLFNAGALDVYLENIHMKKNRPAVKLSVICEKNDFEGLANILFENTTTFGLRYYYTGRRKLVKKIRTLRTKWGGVNVKEGIYNGRTVSISPEYEDCKKISVKFKIPFKKVYDEVKGRIGG